MKYESMTRKLYRNTSYFVEHRIEFGMIRINIHLQIKLLTKKFNLIFFLFSIKIKIF